MRNGERNLVKPELQGRASGRALQVELSNTGVYFEHHVLLWKDPAVTVASRIIAIRFYFPIDLPGRRRSIGGTIQRATWL